MNWPNYKIHEEGEPKRKLKHEKNMNYTLVPQRHFAMNALK